MKIDPVQLTDKLNQSLAGLYLLTGEETLLINEAADAIRQAARQQGFQEREVFHAETGTFDWHPVLESLNSMSLFSEKKIIEIRSSKKNLIAEDFLTYWERPNPDCLVIVITEKIDKKTLTTQWFSKLDHAGVHMEFWPLEGSYLNKWLIQRARKNGLTIAPDAIKHLQDRVEGNLLAAVQELEKLHLLFGNAPITVEQLSNAVADNSRYDVFKLVDAALAGDASHTLKILNGLLEEGTAVLAILAMITRELRTLLSLQEAVEQTQRGAALNYEMLFQKHGIWKKRQALMEQALRRLKKKTLLELIQQAHRVDLSVKGMGSKNAHNELTDLCLSLSGTRHSLIRYNVLPG